MLIAGPINPYSVPIADTSDSDSSEDSSSEEEKVRPLIFLFAVCFLLSAVCCLLSVICCLLSSICFLLSAGINPSFLSLCIELSEVVLLIVTVHIPEVEEEELKAEEEAAPLELG
jgi:hypothetical protein